MEDSEREVMQEGEEYSDDQVPEEDEEVDGSEEGEQEYIENDYGS